MSYIFDLDFAQVAEFVSIAKAKGWIQPTVYQGKYNVIERSVEEEWAEIFGAFGNAID